MSDPVLSLENLAVHFATADGWVTAVDDLTLQVGAGEVLGLVGESGCGKSVTARSVLRLLDERTTRYGGRVLHDGVDLLGLAERDMRPYRGGSISMVFQDPMTSLDPVYTVGDQIGESLRLHRGMGRREARAESAELLRRMGIPDPRRRLEAYPHELSGGMRQRVMIAIAVSSNPRLLIADEPTTALDVTTQAQILDLLRGLTRDLGTSMVFITHDLGVVREVCDRVAIMYLGRVIEQGAATAILDDPRHPYTQGLLATAPRNGQWRVAGRLPVIPGRVPGLADRPVGCAFAPRCPRATDVCATFPDQVAVADEHAAWCWHPHGPAVPARLGEAS